MNIEAFYDPRTGTMSYVVWDEQGGDAVVLDPVLDYNPVGSRIWTESANRLVTFLKAKKLKLHLILETHAHADHMSGAQIVKRSFPDAKIAISRRITKVQEIFHKALALADEIATDGSQFDLLFEDYATLHAGSMTFQVYPTPGHTPACSSYLVEDALFTGDALFLPDVGTGRCDFPGGSASDLFESVSARLYALPDSTRVFPGHDYPTEGRVVQFESSIGEEKARNIQLTALTTKPDYVAAREKRDATLAAPKLLYPSIQVNINAGHMPPAASNDQRFLRIPINA